MPYGTRARGLLRRRASHVLLVGGLASAIDMLRALPLLPADLGGLARVFADTVVFSALLTGLVVAFVSLAQAPALRTWPKAALMVLAAWIAVAVGIACAYLLTLFTPLNYLVKSGILASLAGNLMYQTWVYAAIGTAVALFYAVREREARFAAATRTAELDRAKLQRAMIASRLAVLRARVEPEFLFGALGDVRALYQRDPAAAEELIDALIAYLRAALPQMRGETSTIGREIDLVRAYVSVLQVPRGDALAVHARTDLEVRDVALPPMVLLPLAQAAFSGTDAAQRRRFAVSASTSPDGIRIVIELEGGDRPKTWRGEGPETVGHTLHLYFGSGAQLSFPVLGPVYQAQVRLLPLSEAAPVPLAA